MREATIGRGRPSRAAAYGAGLLAALLLPMSASSTASVAAPAARQAADAAGTPTPPARRARPAVVETALLGRSVRHRPIRAWRLGESGPGIDTVVLVATLHGDEAAVATLLTGLRDGAPVHGVDLWVVPTYNPDGRAAHRRQNARGVDLNRNYAADWRRVRGRYDSGRRPGSEPETRAMMRFLRRVGPDYLVGFHQPLDGVDTLTKRPDFSRRLASALRLPRKRFDCDGGCHGTMTMWFNRRFPGVAVTAEFGARPPASRLRGPLTRRLLRLFGAHR